MSSRQQGVANLPRLAVRPQRGSTSSRTASAGGKPPAKYVFLDILAPLAMSTPSVCRRNHGGGAAFISVHYRNLQLFSFIMSCGGRSAFFCLVDGCEGLASRQRTQSSPVIEVLICRTLLASSTSTRPNV